MKTATRKKRSPRIQNESTSQPRPVASLSSIPKPGPEIEVVLSVLQTISRDIGVEPNTAILLYTLLQTPQVKAHNLLGLLPDEVRARLAMQSLSEAQIPMYGIPLQHIRYASQRVALEVFRESEVDSRHLLMVCLIGSGLLGGGPELGIPDTDNKFILGRSNSAVRALRDSGVNPLGFLQTVRNIPAVDSIRQAPFFFVFWRQGDRTRVLRVEDMGEFMHQSGMDVRYPATLGLLDRSITRSLPALLEFEALLNEIETPESEFQSFFERHPEFLMSDEHVAVRPGVLLSGSAELDLKPDFFLQRRDAPLWDIAELKLPKDKTRAWNAC